MNDFPTRPARLTREQQKALKQRGKDFDAALKQGTRAAGWRYARGEIFRQSGDWFINVLPWLHWERGAGVHMMVKPMALDPLFWDIVGLSENEALPLSFRATGAWVLRPPSTDDHVGPDTSAVETLAAEVLEWGDQRASEILDSISVEAMLASLPSEENLAGQPRALATCLHILAKDLDGAMRLCRVDDSEAHPLMREAGGFTTHNFDGSISTFLDQARDWIARKRRGELSVVF
jgi:hypothetical protein